MKILIALCFLSSTTALSAPTTACSLSKETLKKYRLVNPSNPEDTEGKIPDLQQLEYSDLTCKKAGKLCTVSSHLLRRRIFFGNKKRADQAKIFLGKSEVASIPGKCRIKKYVY